jgi:hypothetical protein
MTKANMNLTEFLQKHDQGDLLRSIAEAVLQLMMTLCSSPAMRTRSANNLRLGL